MEPHLFNLEHISIFMSAALTWRIAAFALKSFPQPTNVYALWALGVVQYIVNNVEEAKSNFSSAQTITGAQSIPGEK